MDLKNHVFWGEKGPKEDIPEPWNPFVSFVAKTPGVALRDMIAMHAIPVVVEMHPDMPFRDLSTKIYQFADEMLKARNNNNDARDNPKD